MRISIRALAVSIGSRVTSAGLAPSFSSPPRHLSDPPLSAPHSRIRTFLRFSVQLPNMSASSGVTPESLKALLEEKVGAVHVEIADLSGTHPPGIFNPCHLLTSWFR